jgi:protoporphyrinogen oxidase
MNDKLTIIGGGITGLAAAYIAAKAGMKVTVLESCNTFGGLLQTFPIAGTRLEFFYHHFFTHDVELLWLVKELGLEDHLSFEDGTMGVLRDGKIFDFNTPVDLLKFSSLSQTDKVRFGLSTAYLGRMASWPNLENVPALEWFQKWAGHTTTEALWKPLLNIKFGPHAKSVPLAWMAGRIRQRMSSRKNGREKLGYLRGSLQVLLERLLLRLRELDVMLHANRPVEAIDVQDDEVRAIQHANGTIEGGKFLFTAPTPILANLVESSQPELADSLRKIQYFGAVCTILEMDRPLSGIYWLNVADPGYPFGGVIEHTNLVPSSHYNDSHIVYLSRYFDLQEPFAAMRNDAIGDLMVEPLSRIFPKFRPEHVKNRYIFRTNTAATVCDLNFSKKVPMCHTPLKQLYLATMAHIYPDERSCNNSIRVAAEASRVMGCQQSVPKGRSLSAQVGF